MLVKFLCVLQFQMGSCNYSLTCLFIEVGFSYFSHKVDYLCLSITLKSSRMCFSIVPLCRGVIDMGHIDISITLFKQYSLLSLVNTYRNVSKYQKHENGHLEKKFRTEYC